MILDKHVRPALIVLAVALAGCAPLSQRPAVDGTGGNKPTEPGAQEPQCGRQFDAEGAGFQTCRAGQTQPSE